MKQTIDQVLGEGIAKGEVGTVRAIDWRMLAAGSILCALICCFTASALGVPVEPGFNGSALCGPSPVWSVIAVGIAFIISLVIGIVATFLINEEAGLVCVCVGLGVLSIRCGSMHSVLQYASGSSVFLGLAVESVILLSFVFIAALGLRVILAMTNGAASPRQANELADATFSTKLSTLAVQVVVTGLLELLLVQADMKAQALGGLAVAAFAGAFAAYSFAPLSQAFWYWAGPIVLAVLAYLFSLFNPAGLYIGEMHGWTAALVRATPLDYASIGTAAALLGHWSARRWAQPEEETEEQPPVAAEPTSAPAP